MKRVPHNRVAVAATAFLLIAFLFSCKKETGPGQHVTEDEAVVYSEESMEAEASFDDIQDISMTAADEEGIISAARTGNTAGRLYPFLALRLRIGQCADITVSPNDSTYPKTVTIDFGSGCLGPDGKFRRGRITLHFTGPIRRSGSVLTISLQDFYLNRAHVEGTKVISNLSGNGNIQFTAQITGGKVTYPNGRGYTYEALKYVKQTEGGATDNDVQDDVYNIEGRSITRFNNGIVTTLTVESPLVKKVACPWISEGLLKVTINNRILSVDYGAPANGGCDNKALLTWNNGNNQRLVTLP